MSEVNREKKESARTTEQHDDDDSEEEAEGIKITWKKLCCVCRRITTAKTLIISQKKTERMYGWYGCVFNDMCLATCRCVYMSFCSCFLAAAAIILLYVYKLYERQAGRQARNRQKKNIMKIACNSYQR